MDVQDITFWSILFAGIELLGLLTAVHAIMNTRTAQGAIAWFFPLVLFPYAAIPLYWIFGRSRLHHPSAHARDKGVLRPSHHSAHRL